MRFIQFIRRNKRYLRILCIACTLSFILGYVLHMLAEQIYLQGYRDGWEAPHAVWDDETFQFLGPEVEIYQGEP